MSHSSENKKWWRILLLVPVATMAVLSIVATGGSSGGGGDGDIGGPPPDVPPIILSTYNFEIGSQVGDANFQVDGGAFQVTVAFGNTLLGSVNLDVSPNNEVTFLSYVTDAGSTVDFTISGTQTPLDGPFTVNVTAAVNADVDFPPTSGSFDVVTATETVTVNILSTGVELSLDGGAATFYTWEEYTADLLDDDTAEIWQQRASLAGGAFEFIFGLVFAAADTLDELEIAVAGPVTASCDMFTGSPPTGVLPQGEVTLTWLGPGPELMPGDSFEWRFNQCWDEGSDELASGVIQFANYIEEIDANNTLTRIGFAPGGGVDGGIGFLDWTISETELNQGVYTINPENDLRLNGGFSLIFQAAP